MKRREALRIGGGAALAAPLVRAGETVEAALVPSPPPAPRFFTADEMALVDELTEMIVPADAHSPGARAARVAAFIDGRLAEAFLPAEADVQRRFREGLARVEVLCREMHGTGFLACTPEQRTAVLTRMAANEEDPKTPEELFFRELKGQTVRGYYTSKIGIHDEMEYKGNTLLAEFVGEVPQ